MKSKALKTLTSIFAAGLPALALAQQPPTGGAPGAAGAGGRGAGPGGGPA